jgi:flagellar hook-basal body complex protein FliE
MTAPIGDAAGSARAAIEAALRRHAESVARVRDTALPAPAQETQRADFSSALGDGLKQIDAAVRDSDRVVDDVAQGRVGDFHEVALRLKESELSFRFAMEVRNKLVDAYREVMRMSV